MDKAKLKHELRTMALKKREKLSTLEVRDYSEDIVKKMVELDEYKRRKDILVYLPIRKEVDTEPLVKMAIRDHKNVYVPKLLSKTFMEFYLFTGYHNLVKGRYGILEPNSDKVKPAGPSFMMVPLVAFNKNNERIGYGGGYFDRYLASHDDVYKVGAAFSCQEVDGDFAEDIDVRLDQIITEI